MKATLPLGGRCPLAWWGAAIALTALACQVACVAPSPTPVPTPSLTPAPVSVRLAGDTSMYPLAQAFISAYCAAEPGTHCVLDESRSRDGLAEVRAGQADVGLVARGLDAAALAREGLSAIPIALDGLVVVVHRDNPAQALSMEQLRRLYAGRVFNWSTVGGVDREVQPVTREEGADARQVFDAQVLQGEPLTLHAIALPTDEAVAEYVANHPEAIGYVALNGLRQGVKGILLQDIPPDDASIRAGSYPLTRPMYLVIRGEASEAVKGLVGYAVGAEGQRIVSGHHVALY